VRRRVRWRAISTDQRSKTKHNAARSKKQSSGNALALLREGTAEQALGRVTSSAGRNPCSGGRRMQPSRRSSYEEDHRNFARRRDAACRHQHGECPSAPHKSTDPPGGRHACRRLRTLTARPLSAMRGRLRALAAISSGATCCKQGEAMPRPSSVGATREASS
jgi:hypothetical protein